MKNLKYTQFLTGISNLFERGIVAGLVTVVVFPFVFVWGLLNILVFPFLVVVYFFFIFVYLVFRTLMPNIIESTYQWVKMPIERLGNIASFAPHFKKERENKQWIRSLNPKGVSTPKTKSWRDGQISSEFRRFASITFWLFDTKDLRPYYVQFLGRVERMIQLNGSTYTFKYLKECMRILVRALAGTPFFKRECNWDLDFYKIGSLWSCTITDPFSGRYSSLQKPQIKEALVNLTTYSDVGKSRFDIKLGRVVTTKVRKNNGDLSGIVSIGKFHPHFSPKAGPNGSMSTWTAAIDAFAFMHEPLKALKLIGWMVDQKAYGYVFWFICLNLVFGLPYIVWFYLLKVEKHFLGLFRYLPSACYYAWKGSFGRIFDFWRLDIQNTHGLIHDRLYLGKLGVVYDQAGKARIVASTNWWIQSAFHGLHTSLFKALKCIPYDGTFDQTQAFEKVILKKDANHKLSGFDLSAATDRLPINLQVDILNVLGVDGQTWKELLDIEWFITIDGGQSVRYAVGQPMGAYSSWAMLALTHHVVVYCSYIQAGVSWEQANYAVLGDDMVVNHDEVGLMYVRIMNSLGLTIKDGKSVISHRFTEFAKLLRGQDVNFSPVGAGAILSACRSGYMFPSLIKSAIGTAVTSTQDLLDLVNRVPGGLVVKRDLQKFVNLVLW